MNPNIYIEEKRVLERVQQRLHETEQPGAPAANIQQAPDHNILQHLIGSLGARFIVLGARMQQFAQTNEHPVARGSSASVLAGRGRDYSSSDPARGGGCSASVLAGRGGANGVTSAHR